MTRQSLPEGSPGFHATDLTEREWPPVRVLWEVRFEREKTVTDLE